MKPITYLYHPCRAQRRAELTGHLSAACCERYQYIVENFLKTLSLSSSILGIESRTQPRRGRRQILGDDLAPDHSGVGVLPVSLNGS